MSNVTILKGSPIQKEAVAASGSTIRPGDLCIINSSGLIAENGSAADEDAITYFAVESESTGRDLDDVYAVGDTVPYVVANRGDEIYAWLETGNNVAIGAKLESNGSGALQALSTGKAVAVATEALNNTSGSDARIKVEVI